MRVLFFFSLLISLGISCHDEDCLPDNCQNFLIENNITDKITNAHASIVDHEIVDDCLKVTLTVGVLPSHRYAKARIRSIKNKK